MTAELLKQVFKTLNIQRKFQMEAIRAVATRGDNATEWVAQVKPAALDKSEITRGIAGNSYKDAAA